MVAAILVMSCMAITGIAEAAPAPSLSPVRVKAAATAGMTPSLKPSTASKASRTIAIDQATPPHAEASNTLDAPIDLAAMHMSLPPLAMPLVFASDLAGSVSSNGALRLAHAHSTASVDESGALQEEPNLETVTLTKGETFVDALARAGVSREDRNEAARAFGSHQDMRKLRPGAEFKLLLSATNRTLFQSLTSTSAQRRLIALSHKPSADKTINLRRNGEAFASDVVTSSTIQRYASVEGAIQGSLFAAAARRGAPDQAIVNFANMFAYDVDFQRDVRPGDEFESIFEVSFGDDGQIVDTGDMLFGRFSWRNGRKEKSYYLFKSKNGGSKPDYFDENGQSAKRLLMKTPIDGARLSSGFGTRRHPILGYRKAHKGVDFAARRGTPIYAAGDGVIERMNRYGGYGNYVRIRHANGYKTAYAHLKGFKRGLRSGARVEQGDVIGYVGTTGRSTGPHLHYEVLLNGKHVNPQRLKIATGVSLKGAEKKRFNQQRAEIDRLREQRNQRASAAPSVADLATQPDRAAYSQFGQVSGN